MTPKNRIDLITDIALHLQEEYKTQGINIFLENYGIKTENISIVNSKKNYVIDLLKRQKNNLIAQVANDLNLENMVFEKHMKINKNDTKIFISHSAKNKNYGNALVELLSGIGLNDKQIIFTSNTAYGIPIGKNIFNWLKDIINEKPFVIYLLSPEYYSSIACLNEMGAAWVVESEHAMIFTPNFKLDSFEFQNGAIDPREIGFFINDEDRLTSFIETLKKSFEISDNQVLINQKSREFITQIDCLNQNTGSVPNPKTVIQKSEKTELDKTTKKEPTVSKTHNTTDVITRFLSDLENNKLKDEEILLIQYISDTARYKLGTGWQEDIEIKNIQVWQDINEYNDALSINYAQVLRRFEIKKLVEVSELTSYGNPKEVRVIAELQNELLALPNMFKNKFKEIVAKKPIEDVPF